MDDLGWCLYKMVALGVTWSDAALLAKGRHFVQTLPCGALGTFATTSPQNECLRLLVADGCCWGSNRSAVQNENLFPPSVIDDSLQNEDPYLSNFSIPLYKVRTFPVRLI